MSITVYGPNGSGSVVAYTAPSGRSVQIQTLSFTIVADGTAGIHRARVHFEDNSGRSIGPFDDLNDSASGQTTTYTYGLGLNASACTTASGWAVTDALPWTEIFDGYTVVVTAINDAGVEIAGDSISGVVLQVADEGAAGTDNTPMPLLVPSAVAA